MPRGGRVKRYSQEFKQTAIELAMADEDRSITEIASELGVNHKTLYNWVYTYKEKNGLHEPITEEDSAQAEIKRLKRELKQVTQERDILKKATAYFAKEAM